MKTYPSRPLARRTLSAVSALSLLFCPLALSQTDSEDSDDEAIFELEGFVVSGGIRNSLEIARQIKRSATGFQDSIVAEDIAKFPDLNLAESLQRLPGVAINREAGEGRRVSLRGLGPDFTRVQLNGMEVLGNVDSPMDSRGQRTRDRAFDFNIFASELFNRLDLYKSFQADQDEGGLAGSVGLYTARPFDYGEGNSASISSQLGTNTATGDLQPRLAAQFSHNGGDFGALFSVAYSSRDTEEQGYNTYRWRLRSASGSDISNLPQAQQDAINDGEFRWARGNRLSVWESHQDRLGITGALQWRPSEKLTVTLDLLLGKFEGDREELHLATRGSSGTVLHGGTTVDGVSIPGSVLNEVRVNSDNEVIYADVSGANFASETRRQTTKNDFTQIVLSTEYQASDTLKIDTLIGTESSEYDLPISDKFYLEAFGDVITDYSSGGDYGMNTYGWDTTSSSNWNAHEIDLYSSFQESKIDNIKVDATLDVSRESAIKFGASYRTFTNSGFENRINNLLRSDFQSGAVDDNPAAYIRVFDSHDAQDWAIVDWDAAFSALGVTRAVGPVANSYGVDEDTLAAYVQYQWDSFIGDMAFKGSAGLRYFETDVTSRGVANIGPISASDRYSDVLPALNMSLDVAKDVKLRFAASQNINRPSLSALAFNGSISEDAGEYTVRTGNPGLDPYDSTNFDLSLERYFGEVGFIGFGYFYKDISGFIGNETLTNVPFSSTGLASGLLPGLTQDTLISEYRRPINYADTDLSGFEITFQTDLDFMPVEGFGMVSNITLVDSDLQYATPDQIANGESIILPMNGLSDTVINTTFYYENDTWGARVSANYRSDYVSGGPTGSDEDSRGFESTTYVDFSAFYQLTENLKWTFDAVNLTDEKEVQYSDSSRRLYNTTTSGTTFFSGISYKF